MHSLSQAQLEEFAQKVLGALAVPYSFDLFQAFQKRGSRGLFVRIKKSYDLTCAARDDVYLVNLVLDELKAKASPRFEKAHPYGMLLLLAQHNQVAELKSEEAVDSLIATLREPRFEPILAHHNKEDLNAEEEKAVQNAVDLFLDVDTPRLAISLLDKKLLADPSPHRLALWLSKSDAYLKTTMEQTLEHLGVSKESESLQRGLRLGFQTSYRPWLREEWVEAANALRIAVIKNPEEVFRVIKPFGATSGFGPLSGEYIRKIGAQGLDQPEPTWRESLKRWMFGSKKASAPAPSLPRSVGSRSMQARIDS